MNLKQLLQKNNNYGSSNPSYSSLGTDKESQHSYITEFYEEHFAPFKNKSINLLEIGANTGSSLCLWRDYFLNGRIFSVDVENKLIPEMSNYPDVTVFFENAYTLDFVKKLPDFDIIIDDGPHTENSQIDFINLYIKKVKPGGLMVIEDIQNISSIEKFQALVIGYETQVIDTREKYGVKDNIMFIVRC